MIATWDPPVVVVDRWAVTPWDWTPPHPGKGAASSSTSLEWLSNGETWNAILLDKWGHQIKSWKGGQTAKKVVTQTISLPDIPSGHYYIHLQQGNQSVTRGIVVR